MPEEVTVRFRWTFEVLAEATRWQLRESGRSRHAWGLWVLVGMGVAMLAAGAVIGQPAGYVPGSCVAGLALFILRVGPRSLTKRLRRHYEASNARDADIEWRVTEAAVYIRDRHGSADLTWGAFVKAVRTPAGLMLYTQPGLFQWLPRAAFATEAEFAMTAGLARQQVAAYRELK